MNLNSYKKVINECFNSIVSDNIPSFISPISDVCNKIFVLNVDPVSENIPTFGLNAYNNRFLENKVAVGVRIIDGIYNIRGADGLLKEAFKSSMHLSLKKFKSNKGEIYYAGKGLILDEDFNPILTFITNSTNDMFKCYIDPTVFTIHAKSLIGKHIISKLIPYLVDNTVRCNYREYKCSIIIDKINYIQSASVPYNFSNEDINKVALENIEDLYDSLKY